MIGLKQKIIATITLLGIDTVMLIFAPVLGIIAFLISIPGLVAIYNQ